MVDVTVAYAVADRPHPAEQINGDGWSVSCSGPLWRFTVIDGLGHGPDAARASAVIKEMLDQIPPGAIDEALERCHAAARGTRGAAVSITEVDTERRVLTFGGLGNVEGLLLREGQERHLVPMRGIVGGAFRRPHPVSFDVPARWLLAMYSDGLMSRVKLEFPPAGVLVPQELANAALARWARPTDDATILVAHGIT